MASEIVTASTGWGAGVPYAGWIVVDLRDPDSAVIIGVVAEHAVECVADHGNTRHLLLTRAFMDTDAYQRLRALGYNEIPILDFARYPGGDGVLRVLGFMDGLEGADPREHWRKFVCLRYERVFTDISKIIDAEYEAFGMDPLKDSDVIALATGPIPRPNDAMPAMEE